VEDRDGHQISHGRSAVAVSGPSRGVRHLRSAKIAVNEAAVAVALESPTNPPQPLPIKRFGKACYVSARRMIADMSAQRTASFARNRSRSARRVLRAACAATGALAAFTFLTGCSTSTSNLFDQWRSATAQQFIRRGDNAASNDHLDQAV